MKISDFNITGRPIPEKIADKILEHHLTPLVIVQMNFPFKIYVSSKSGYRPRWYELKKGRSGNSQHTFVDKGATDVTCDDFSENKDALLEALIKNTDYSRFAIYDTFIHCDYKNELERWVYNKNWVKQYSV